MLTPWPDDADVAALPLTGTLSEQLTALPRPRFGESTLDYCRRLPVRRWAHEVEGTLLLFPRTGLIMVPYVSFEGGWNCVVVRGDGTYRSGDYRLSVSDCEIVTALEVPLDVPEPAARAESTRGCPVLGQIHTTVALKIVEDPKGRTDLVTARAAGIAAGAKHWVLGPRRYQAELLCCEMPEGHPEGLHGKAADEDGIDHLVGLLRANPVDCGGMWSVLVTADVLDTSGDELLGDRHEGDQ